MTPMTHRTLDKKRLYDDGCAAAHAMDLIGERWALLVVRELMLGPKRFSGIRRNLNGISANVLTQRLEELERIGIVIRRQLPPPASLQVYDLTDWGRDLEPVFQSLGRWAARSPFKGPGPMSVNSLMMSFVTMFSPSHAKGLAARISMTLDGEPCHVIIHKQAITAQRGTISDPDLSIIASTQDIAALIYGSEPLENWLDLPGVKVAGNKEILAVLPSLFPLPEPVTGQVANFPASHNQTP